MVTSTLPESECFSGKGNTKGRCDSSAQAVTHSEDMLWLEISQSKHVRPLLSHVRSETLGLEP